MWGFMRTDEPKTKTTRQVAVVVGVLLVAALILAVALGPPGSVRISVSQQYVVQGETEPLFHLVRDRRATAADIRAQAAKNPAVVRTYRTWTGDSLLGLAAEKGRVDLAQALIQLGADVNGKDVGARPVSFTPLCAAVVYDQPEMIRFLLAAGADPNDGGTSGFSATEAANAEGTKPTTREALLAGAAKPEPGPEPRGE